MAKLTAEQQRQLDELTALADAPDGDVEELYVKDEKGRETRLTGAHATKWLKNLGLVDDDDAGDAGDGTDGDDAGGGAGAKDEPPAAKTPKWFR